MLGKLVKFLTAIENGFTKTYIILMVKEKTKGVTGSLVL